MIHLYFPLCHFTDDTEKSLLFNFQRTLTHNAYKNRYLRDAFNYSMPLNICCKHLNVRGFPSELFGLSTNNR